MSVPQVKNNNILLLHSTQIAIFYVPIVHYRFFLLGPLRRRNRDAHPSKANSFKQSLIGSANHYELSNVLTLQYSA